MKKTEILIIGAGGIGSYLSRELNRLIMNSQIDSQEVNIKIVDNDEVEIKNIKYQNFKKEEVLEKKAEVIGKRYLFLYEVKKIESSKDLEGYDLIVLAVDNNHIRKLVYDYCFEKEKKFIDLRSEGRNVAFFTNNEDKTILEKSLGIITKEGGSCQLKYELDKGIIQNGNVIIATIGSQLVLNYLREEMNPPSMSFRI